VSALYISPPVVGSSRASPAALEGEAPVESVHERIVHIVRKVTASRRPSDLVRRMRPKKARGGLPVAYVWTAKVQPATGWPSADQNLETEHTNAGGYDLCVMRRLSGCRMKAKIGDI